MENGGERDVAWERDDVWRDGSVKCVSRISAAICK